MQWRVIGTAIARVILAVTLVINASPADTTL